MFFKQNKNRFLCDFWAKREFIFIIFQTLFSCIYTSLVDIFVANFRVFHSECYANSACIHKTVCPLTSYEIAWKSQLKQTPNASCFTGETQLNRLVLITVSTDMERRSSKSAPESRSEVTVEQAATLSGRQWSADRSLHFDIHLYQFFSVVLLSHECHTKRLVTRYYIVCY